MNAVKRTILYIAVVGLMLAVGCAQGATHMSVNRDEARQRWASSRAEVAVKLAQGCYQRGEFARANEHIASLLQENVPYAPLYIMAARLSAEKGDLDQARVYADQATRVDPRSAEAAYVLGTINQTLGDDDKALEQFTVAANLDPGQSRYVLAQAEMLVAQGNPSLAAITLNEAAVRLAGKAEIHAAIGDVLSVMKRYGEAARSYRTALRMSTDSQEEIKERLAVALFYSGAYSDAAATLAELKPSGPDAAAGWAAYMRAECLLALGRVDEAQAIYTAAAAAKPGASTALLGLAKCDILSDRLPQAHQFLQQVLAHRPRDAEGNALLGYVLVAEGHPDEATPHLEQALKDPTLTDRAAVEKLLNEVRNGLEHRPAGR